MRSHADRQPTAQLKFPKLQLVWVSASAPEAKWHLRLIGHCYKGTPRRLFIFLSLRSLLAWGAGTALAAYLIGTATLAWLWGQNPYNQISYADLTLPTHWSQLREKRGQGQIDEGVHELRGGRYATGLMLLTSGVARKPSAVRGRMALAQAYMNMGYLHRGLQILEDGLVFGPPPKMYREALFQLSAYLEDYELVLELADRLEKILPPNDHTTRRWLLIQRVTALEKLHRYDEIEQLRSALVDSPSFAVEAAWARAQAVRGQPDIALQEIARDPERFGTPADRYQLQLDLAVAARNLPVARAAIRFWQDLEPAAALPRIKEIIALIQLNETNEAKDRLQRFFLHYSTEPRDLVLLFKKLNELPDVKWLQAAYQEATDSGALSPEIRILYVQGLLMAGKVPEALVEFNLTKAFFENAKINDGGWSEGTGRLINVIVSDSPSNRSLFIDFFRTHRLKPDAYRFALRSLGSAGVNTVAGELAIIARNRFPALQDAALVAAGSTVTVTQPGDSPTGTSLTETEAHVELRRIDAELQAGSYQPAFARLKKVEQADLPALRSELLTRRIQLLGALREETELSATLQLYLSSPDVSQSWLHQLATQWAGEQRTDSALTLARETYAKFPQARWAMDLLSVSSPKFVLPSEQAPAAIHNEAEARMELRQIDEALEAGRFSAALEQIKRVEAAKLTSLQPEILLRRIQAHGSLGEQTELSAALGYYLSGQTVNQTALRNLALQWDDAQHRDSALSVTRETLAKFPQARWAQELRKKIEGDLLVAPEKTN